MFDKAVPSPTSVEQPKEFRGQPFWLLNFGIAMLCKTTSTEMAHSVLRASGLLFKMKIMQGF